MFKVKLTARAKKELKLISKQHQLALGQILEELKEDPFLGKPLTRELARRFSYKIGIYRIVYKIAKRDKIVFILTVGHRSMVYKTK